MKIYLVRHGDYNDVDIDPEKGLSHRGEREITAIGDFLREQDFAPDETWHSEKKRARETAAILSPDGLVLEKKKMNPTDDVDSIAAEIESSELKQICLAGHLPFLPTLAAKLLAGSKHAGSLLHFETGSAACLQREADRWELLWLISPKELAKNSN